GDAERLRKQYAEADPRNHRVKADLERRLEAALAREEKLRSSTPTAPGHSLKKSDASELASIAQDLEEIWTASTTTNEDRKTIIRTLVTRIAVRNTTAQHIDLELEWVSGARQPLRVLKAAGVAAAAQADYIAGKGPDEIAQRLTDAGMTTASGKPI